MTILNHYFYIIIISAAILFCLECLYLVGLYMERQINIYSIVIPL